MSNSKNSAGKGDRPRNCFSKQYWDNYDLIKWPSKTNTDSFTKTTREKNNNKKRKTNTKTSTKNT